MKITCMAEISKLMSADTVNALHEEAFLEILNKIVEFMDKAATIPEDSPGLAWVCNASPGTGKTTALRTMAKLLLVNAGIQTPLLLVFNNNRTMDTFYQNIHEFCLEHGLQRAVIQIHSEILRQDPKLELEKHIEEFRIICITRQRFRDLRTLDNGKFNRVYEFYRAGCTRSKRLIIVDEMPIFQDEQIYDLGEDHNCLNWFDQFCHLNGLSSPEVSRARSLIANAFQQEIQYNSSRTTLRLRRHFSPDEYEMLQTSLSCFVLQGETSENQSRFRWFCRLLEIDATGVFDTLPKRSILCAEWLDYRSFGSILILDGTAGETVSLYRRGGFELQPLQNRHDYNRRLYLHFRDVNTSSKARTRIKGKLYRCISDDLRDIYGSLDEQYPEKLEMLVLPAKSEISYYRKENMITAEQYERYFAGRDDEKPSHIRNVTGTNDFAQYSLLALTSLPINPPHDYKLKAIAAYGTDVATEMHSHTGKGRSIGYDRWFMDERVQTMFEEITLAELSQIIHRSGIRQLHSNRRIDIVIYTNKIYWLGRLQQILRLEDGHCSVTGVWKKEMLAQKCSKYAIAFRTALLEQEPGMYSPYALLKGKGSDFFSDHWPQYESLIREEFAANGIRIDIKGKRKKLYIDKNNGNI